LFVSFVNKNTNSNIPIAIHQIGIFQIVEIELDDTVLILDVEAQALVSLKNSKEEEGAYIF
jgi:hypothetical protein